MYVGDDEEEEEKEEDVKRREKCGENKKRGVKHSRFGVDEGFCKAS